MPPRRQPQAPALALDVATIADLRRANAAFQRDNNGLRRQIELLTQRMDGSMCFLKMPPKRVQALAVVVPEFDGELDDDVIDWLSRVEEIFEFQDVPADRRVPLVKIRLHGRAQAWWQQLKQTRCRHRKSKITDWEKFKKHVKAAFLPYNYECDLSQRFPTLCKGSLGGSVSVSVVGGLRSRMFVSGGGDWHLSPKFVSMTQGSGGMYDEMNRSWDLSTEEEFCSYINRMGVRDDEYVSQGKYRDAEFSWFGSPGPFRVDTRDLFVDGSIVDIPPSSGNPIYDDYVDECYFDDLKHGVVEKFVEFCGNGMADLKDGVEFSSHLSDLISEADSNEEVSDECYVDDFEDIKVELALSLGKALGELRLWDLAAGVAARRFVGHSKDVLSYLSTYKLKARLAGHNEYVNSVAVSPDGSLCASGGTDGVILLWDLAEGEEAELKHGSVVIAAITSCTNTSNPSVMLGAALVAKRACELGLKVKPWVKTSLTPGGSGVAERYLDQSGLRKSFDEQGLHIVGYGCTTCIGKSGDLNESVSATITENEIVIADVLSGNRNFEGRVHPLTRANYLASPPVVVAYVLAGTVTIDFDKELIGIGKDGKSVQQEHSTFGWKPGWSP